MMVKSNGLPTSQVSEQLNVAGEEPNGADISTRPDSDGRKSSFPGNTNLWVFKDGEPTQLAGSRSVGDSVIGEFESSAIELRAMLTGLKKRLLKLVTQEVNKIKWTLSSGQR